MKTLIGDIWREAQKEIEGKLFLAPAVIGALISGAVTVGTKISADRKAKKAAAELDKQAAEEKAEEKRLSERSISVAERLARRRDPTLAAKKRAINQNAANTVGRVTSSAGSTQEIVNAAQGVQTSVDNANITAETQAATFEQQNQQFLANRFDSAGALRLQGNAFIDRRLAQNLAAIGANAQAEVDTAQNIGKLLTDTLAFTQVNPPKTNP